jgi:hypothetical protein
LFVPILYQLEHPNNKDQEHTKLCERVCGEIRPMIMASQGFQRSVNSPQRIGKDTGNGINNWAQVDEKDENPEEYENVLPLDFHGCHLLSDNVHFLNEKFSPYFFV